MKGLVLFTGLAATVLAQAPSGGIQPPANMPTCGANPMLQAISLSHCGFTDVPCMCKSQEVSNAITESIPKACSSQADRSVFLDFFNAYCVGQPGFPLQIKVKVGSASKVNAGVLGAMGAAILVVIGL